MKETTL